MRARAAAFLAHHPLFAAALSVAAAAALTDFSPVAGAAWTAAAALAVLSLGQRKTALAWALLGTVAVASLSLRNRVRGDAARALMAAGETTASGRALRDAEGDASGWQTPVSLTNPSVPGAVVVWRGCGERPVAGAMVSAKGRFEALEPPRNPGEFDEAEFLRRRGIAARFEAGGRAHTLTTGRLAAAGAWLRHGFKHAVTAGLDPESPAALTIRAVVIGEYPRHGDALVAAFRDSGTLHIFSVSGMHVAMVAGIGWFFLKRLGVPRRPAVGILLALVFGYTWITGNSPPAVRSAWMAAAFLGAFVFRRRPDLLNSLGLVLLLASLWNGHLLFQPGVQLSYGVVAAIAIGSSRATRWFSWMARPEPYLPADLRTPIQRRSLAIRQHLASGLGTSTAAAIGSFPLTAWHFGIITPISIVATVLLVVPVYALLALALLSATLHPLAPPLASCVNHANAAVARVCIATASLMTKVPGGNLHLRHARHPSLVIYDLDYGAGAAALSHGDGSGALIDCGDRYSFKSLVAPSLRNLGITPDTVILTHPDGAHLGGASQVWSTLPIRRAVLPVGRSLSKTYQSWVRDAPAAGIECIPAAAAPIRLAPDATLEVLHVPPEEPHTRISDDRVAIHRLHWHGWRILFTSDAGHLSERALLATGRDITADVIVAGRHARDISLTDEFLQQVNPKAIVATNKAYPPELSLPPEQAAYWRKQGITVFDQAQSGGVTLTLADDGSLLLEGFADGSRHRIDRTP